MTVDGRIVVVCTGNICRSPYIERRLRQALARTSIAVTSAGTAALVGREMDPSSARLLVDAAADVDGFRACQLTEEMVAGADLVVTAAREHRTAASRLHPRALRRTLTLMDLADLLDGVDPSVVSRTTSPADGSWVARVVSCATSRRGVVSARLEGVDIVDPVGGTMRDFRSMADQVERALRSVVPVLGRA